MNQCDDHIRPLWLAEFLAGIGRGDEGKMGEMKKGMKKGEKQSPLPQREKKTVPPRKEEGGRVPPASDPLPL